MAMVTGPFSAHPEVEHMGDGAVAMDAVDVEEEGILEPVEVEQEQVRFHLLL